MSMKGARCPLFFVKPRRGVILREGFCGWWFGALWGGGLGLGGGLVMGFGCMPLECLMLVFN